MSKPGYWPPFSTPWPGFVHPAGVFDGMKVIAPFEGRTGVWCTVTCAAGDMARVTNEKRGIDRWHYLRELMIKESP